MSSSATSGFPSSSSAASASASTATAATASASTATATATATSDFDTWDSAADFETRDERRSWTGGRRRRGGGAESGGLRSTVTEIIILASTAVKKYPTSYCLLLILTTVVTVVAFSASGLNPRFFHYGDSPQLKRQIWWMSTTSWPISALLLVSFYKFKGEKPTPLTVKLALWYILLGVLNAGQNYAALYATQHYAPEFCSYYGTTAPLFSTVFGYLIVKNRLHLLSSTSMVIVMTSAVLVVCQFKAPAENSDSGRVIHIAMFFLMDCLVSIPRSLFFAVAERVIAKDIGRGSAHVVLEMHAAVMLCSFAITTVGFIEGGGGFKEMKVQALRYGKGEDVVYMIYGWAGAAFGTATMGSIVLVYLASTVTAGAASAAAAPVSAVLAIVLNYTPENGIMLLSLVVAVAGLGLYAFGQCVQAEKRKIRIVL